MNDIDDHNDYLWDGSGPPDPLIAQLEQRLAPLRRDSKAAPPRPAASQRATILRIAFLTAAAVLVAIPFLYIPAAAPGAGDPSNSPAYEVTLDSGSARVITNFGAGRTETAELAVGVPHKFPLASTLACDDAARARVRIVGSGEVTEVGEAAVQGPSRLRLDRSTAEIEKLYLQNGTLSARISSSVRPRLFQVGTPSGTAVDLGCIYTMHVRDDGRTELRVSVGRVAFEIQKRSVYVWSGAQCIADAKIGASTPVSGDSSESFKNSVERFDQSNRDMKSLDDALAAASLHDAASLWHMLQSTDGAAREKVYDRLAALSPPPGGVAKPAILRADSENLERWRVDIMGW